MAYKPRVTNKKKKAGKLMIWVLVIGVASGGGGLFWIDQVVEKTGRSLMQTEKPQDKLDCIIVPGALVIGDQPSLMLRDRLDQALTLYQDGWSDRFLLSGDHGQKDYDEVGVMCRYLVEQGVPLEHIFLDHAGFDTYATLYRARDVFEVQRAVVVTQTFHLNRALYIAKHLDLHVTGVSSDLRPYQKAVYYRIRELAARVKAFLECRIIRPEPKYLGDPFPIWGDGRLTQDGCTDS